MTASKAKRPHRIDNSDQALRAFEQSACALERAANGALFTARIASRLLMAAVDCARGEGFCKKLDEGSLPKIDKDIVALEIWDLMGRIDEIEHGAALALKSGEGSARRLRSDSEEAMHDARKMAARMGRVDPDELRALARSAKGRVTAWIHGKTLGSGLASGGLESEVLRLREANRRLFAMDESAREQLGRELHDEMGQWLAALRAEAGALSIELGGRRQKSGGSVEAIEAIAGEMRSSLRSMLGRLDPGIRGGDGLPEKIRSLARDLGGRGADPIRVEIRMQDDAAQGASREAALAAYRTIQEALTNIRKHSGARRVEITLRSALDDRTGIVAFDDMEIIVDDDGKGCSFDGSDSTGQSADAGRGLSGMTERILSLGGMVNVGWSPLGGTRVWAILPKDKEQPVSLPALAKRAALDFEQIGSAPCR